MLMYTPDLFQPAPPPLVISTPNESGVFVDGVETHTLPSTNARAMEAVEIKIAFDGTVYYWSASVYVSETQTGSAFAPAAGKHALPPEPTRQAAIAKAASYAFDRAIKNGAKGKELERIRHFVERLAA